ncbi:tetratricopeptide repeat protein [Streptomyces sp. M600PL45_2]|uniref:Tetratricopeptide repeat protein n=1 Tax=Streptomyces marispadix TaxID=2922868 RepID=A0ABS9SZT3_9ACTN|nr:tetratricopeptide repeat protein [Streptomyces marispadix]MCH6161791.1 tetratricopeptide repeat protein [Streptomyces marispadix]
MEQSSVAVVTGLAGVGKTELVLQVARQAMGNSGWFPGGVLFIDIFGYDEDRTVPPERALEEFLRALGVTGEQIPSGLQARTRLFRSLLATYSERGERLLVIVDNAASEEQVRPLLPGDSATAALITSRNTLHVGGYLRELEVLEAKESVDMLHGILRQARTTDTRIDEQLTDAERIAELCGNLPLALHICAALLADSPARPLSSLVRALTDVHRRLDGLQREERSVRAAFELSYRRLTKHQALLFRLLALVPGNGLSTETAAVVADTSFLDAENLLQQLARAHLIDAGMAWGRWRMHDLLRLYASERDRAHDAGNESGAALERLYQHFMTRVRDADTWLRSVRTEDSSSSFRSREEAVSWLKDEREGLVAACGAALEVAPEITCWLAHRLTRFLDHYRYLDDWNAVADLAVAAALRLEDLSEATHALQIHGLAMREVGQLERAQEAHELALKLYRETRDRFGESVALDSLGLVHRHLGRLDDAIKAHTQALRIRSEIGQVEKAPAIRSNLGNTLCQAGRAPEAVEALSAAFDGFNVLGDVRGAAMAQANLGRALVESGREEEAITVCRASLRLADELGDTHVKALALCNRGRALVRTGPANEAADELTQAAELYFSLNDDFLASGALLELGSLYLRIDRPTEAIETLYRAADAARGSGRQIALEKTLIALSDALKSAERFEEAIRAAFEAYELRHTYSDPEAKARAISRLGALFIATDQVECGAAAYADAADVFHSLGNQPVSEGIARQTLGWLLTRLGAPEDSVKAQTRAAELFREADDRTREGNALRDLAESLALLDRLEGAVEACARAVDAFHTAGEHLSEGEALQNLGGFLAADEHWTQSAEATERAASIFRALDEPRLEGRTLHNLGVAQLALNQPSLAIPTYRQAVDLLRAAEDRLSEGHALLNLGAAQLGSDMYAPAAETLSQAIDIFQALDESTLEDQARSVLAAARKAART